MTRGTTRLGAAVAALALASASAAAAWSGARPLVELERDDCAGPVAMVMAAADGSAVFHAVEAGRYVITLPPDVGGLTLVVAEGGEGRWIPGRLSPVTDGRRYAVGADGRRIVVAVARSGGEIRLRLDGL